MLILYGTCMSGLARMFPPISPTWSAGTVADFYIDHKIWIRIGVAGCLLTSVIALPFLATIVLRIRRVEGQWGMLTVTQLFAAVIFVPALLFPFLVMAAAAFRPDTRPAEITLALNDVFWLMFIGIVGTIIVQNIVLAITAFIDKTDPLTFPRWYGYLNLWVALLSLPGCVVVVFNDGPLAWAGVFAFYIPGAALTIWMFTTTYVLLRGIKAEQMAQAA